MSPKISPNAQTVPKGQSAKQPSPKQVHAQDSPITVARTHMASVVHGNALTIDLLLIALTARGHVLLEGIPGVGKTTLAKAFSEVTGLTENRVQMTPDLLPSDITGQVFYDQKTQAFSFKRGPIFAQVLLADELNRTPPRTQSALLEAMQERQVTIEGKTLQLPEPFLVIATKNPIEVEGVYPLPGAELDRFLVSAKMSYPGRAAELRMLHGVDKLPKLQTSEGLVEYLWAEYDQVMIHEDLFAYMLDIADATRDHEMLTLGASPRSVKMLAMASRAKAVLEGRRYVIPDDIQAMAGPALRHRLIPTATAELRGIDSDSIVADILEQVRVPILRSS